MRIIVGETTFRVKHIELGQLMPITLKIGYIKDEETKKDMYCCIANYNDNYIDYLDKFPRNGTDDEMSIFTDKCTNAINEIMEKITEIISKYENKEWNDPLIPSEMKDHRKIASYILLNISKVYDLPAYKEFTHYYMKEESEHNYNIDIDEGKVSDNLLTFALSNYDYVVYRRKLYSSEPLEQFKYHFNKKICIFSDEGFFLYDYSLYIIGEKCYEADFLSETLPQAIILKDDNKFTFHNYRSGSVYLDNISKDKIIVLHNMEKEYKSILSVNLWSDFDQYSSYYEHILQLVDDLKLEYGGDKEEYEYKSLYTYLLNHSQ